MVKYVKGNLLDSNCDYICHQVNCQGVMRSGIAKQIRERWPEVYEAYREKFERYHRAGLTDNDMLGDLGTVYIPERDGYVVNMYTQRGYVYDAKRYTSYDAFACCLNLIAFAVPDGYTIGFPKNIGCGLGGGNWKVISALIEEILGEEYDVYIYELEETT